MNYQLLLGCLCGLVVKEFPFLLFKFQKIRKKKLKFMYRKSSNVVYDGTLNSLAFNNPEYLEDNSHKKIQILCVFSFSYPQKL